MEVASPLSFAPTSTGGKRSLGSCSPTLLEAAIGRTNRPATDFQVDERLAKRRRFHADTSVESLSEHFSSHSPFFSSSGKVGPNALGSSSVQNFRRGRAEASSPVQEDLNRVVEEQAAVIESLKSEHKKLENQVSIIKGDHERVMKDNQILRKAIKIQQERQKQTESELRHAYQEQANSQEQIRKLEQVILSLRYHLQAQQPSYGNDFMHLPPRPPDVY